MEKVCRLEKKKYTIGCGDCDKSVIVFMYQLWSHDANVNDVHDDGDDDVDDDVDDHPLPFTVGKGTD